MNDRFGFYRGENADGILILGESHHWVKEDASKSLEEREMKEQNYKTETVVNNYLSLYSIERYDSCYEFFEKIVSSFGFRVEDRVAFWNSVYFKNYVCDRLCGVGDDKAKAFINQNRAEYNDALFSFLNKQNITTVFVFSRLVYNNSLPGYATKNEKYDDCDDGTLKVAGERDYISHCKYLGGISHKATDIVLNHDVEFFGMRHPSARGGFEPKNYSAILSKHIRNKNNTDERITK